MNRENFLRDKMCQWFIDLYKNNDEIKHIFNEKKSIKTL